VWIFAVCSPVLTLPCFSAGSEKDKTRELLKRLPQPISKSSVNAKEDFVDFSFDQVDVSTVVKLVGDITGLKLVLGEGVQGKITVVSPRVPRNDVYPLFVSILESIDCSVVTEGNICRVVARPARVTPSAPVVGKQDKMPKEGVVTKVIHLEHVSAVDLRRVLESKVSGGKAGAIGAIDDTNHIIVTDTASSVRRIEKIVAEIDQPGLARVTEVVPLQYAGAEDLSRQLEFALAERENRAERLRRRLPQVGDALRFRQSAVVVSAPHSNSLILVGTPSQISELRRIIEQMDVDTPAGTGRLNAIFLKYISAEEAAKSITALLTKSAGKEDAGPRKRAIAIEASVENNALLVDATPGDYEVVKRLIEQLDHVPQQVHIEVVIAEVSVSDDLSLGVEMAAVDMPSEKGSTVIQGSSRLVEGADTLMSVVQEGLFPRGISVGIAHGTGVDEDGRVIASFPAVLNIDAVKKDGRFKILSSPSLVAQNNKEASVNIVNEIPILKSTIEGGTGSDRDVIQNIDRKDVGIKLKLTPHIIAETREVQMDLNPSIEAIIEPGSASTQFTPTIARREVSTTVTVPDGKTIVIAGLTRENETKIVKRVPLLGSIPLLGWLFRHTVDATEKTDLLIFVTPRIVTDMAAAQNVMQDWKKKTGLETHDKE